MSSNWFLSKVKRQSDRDDILDELVTLIRVAQEEESVFLRLNQVLSLPDAQRQIELTNWIQHCEKQQAPEPFVSSLKLLLDNGVAKLALEAIQA